LKALEFTKGVSLKYPKDKDIKIIIMFVRGATAEEVRETMQTAANTALPYGPVLDDAANEYTIVDAENGFYELLEINRFVGGGACDKASMATINRFSKQKLEWEKPLQRLEMKTTFNGCNADFAVMPTQAIQTNKTSEKGQVEEMSGLIFDIMKLIAKIGNFTPQFFYNQMKYAYDDGDGEEAYDENEFNSYTHFVATRFFNPLKFVQFVEKEFFKAWQLPNPTNLQESYESSHTIYDSYESSGILRIFPYDLRFLRIFP